MRLGIYAESLNSANPTGISGYVRGLISALADANNDLQINLYYEARRDKPDLIGFENHSKIHRRGLFFPKIHKHPRWWWNCYLPLALKFDRIDVFHGPNHIVPKYGPPSVCTIHDLAFYHMKVHGAGLDAYLKRWTDRSISCASRVIAVSKSTADDCIAAGAAENKISVIYQGFTPPQDGQKTSSIVEFPVADNLKSIGYFLFIGTLQPRKNIPLLIDEYARFAYMLGWDMVIAGADGDSSYEVQQAINQHQLNDRVHLTGFISDEQRAELFKYARCFVYPSKYEGFGLPILESMAAGVPVIAANNSSLPEAVGDAGVQVDVSISGCLSRAMLELHQNEDQQRKLIERGYEHIKNFSWKKCAERTLDVYKSLTAI